jgi:hypothetical protein
VRVVFIVFLLVLDVAPRAGHGARRRASRASLVENEARRDLSGGHSWAVGSHDVRHFIAFFCLSRKLVTYRVQLAARGATV